MTGEINPSLARHIRDLLSRELETRTVCAVAAHFPGMRFGRLIQAQGQREWLSDTNQ